MGSVKSVRSFYKCRITINCQSISWTIENEMEIAILFGMPCCPHNFGRSLVFQQITGGIFILHMVNFPFKFKFAILPIDCLRLLTISDVFTGKNQ